MCSLFSVPVPIHHACNSETLKDNSERLDAKGSPCRRVRRRCATNALPSARKEEFIEEQRCFTEDEGRPLGVGLAGAGFKPPQAAAAKIRGGER